MNKHGDLNLEVFVEPSFGENGYLLWRNGEPDCWIVDPGLPPQQPNQIAAAIEQHQLTPRAILVTHGHADHIGGIPTILQLLGDVPIVCPKGEEQLLVDPAENLSASLGLPISVPEPDQIVEPGEVLALADLEWRVLDVSGHSPGGAAYYCEQAGVVLVGDAIISDSIGRTDFPHSNHKQFITNIRENLLSLPDETMLYSGHGEEMTIGHVCEYNMVLRQELKQW